MMDLQAQAIIESGGIGATPSAPAQPNAAGGDDRLAQFERLAALHASGVLSDQEFEAEKARILSS
jgi:hypothetical protein